MFENLGIKTIESKIERLPTSRLLTSKILPDGHQGARAGEGVQNSQGNLHFQLSLTVKKKKN